MRASLKEYLRGHPDAGVEDIRNFCIRRIGEIGGFYGGAAQQLAETMLAEVSGLNGYAAPRLDGYVYAPEKERVDGDVRYLMEKWKDGDGQGFIDAVCATARANAEFGANATMAHAAAKQAERNGKKGGKRKEARGGGQKQASALRFARVPMGGRETCDFCIMLASRGFVYHTKETAGELKHYHANCACRIVPGFEGDKVEGYDPDYYYDVWKNPEDHPEVRDARNARRRELYREKHPKNAKSGPAKWSDPEIEALATPEDVASWLASKDIEATDRFLELPIGTQKGAVAGFKHAVDKYGECDVARFDSISDSVNMGKYDPLTSTIKISDQVDDPFLTGLHEAMHALDNHRSGKMGSLDDDAYSRSVLVSVKKKLRANAGKKYKDILLDFTGWDLRLMNYLLARDYELIPVAAESSFLEKHSKLGDALLEEVLSHDQV